MKVDFGEVVLRRLVVLVVVMLVVGVVGSGAVLSEPAVGQATPESGLCDAGETVQFGDVGDADYGAAYILCMRALGLSQGRSDGDFGPGRELNRGQMATFLIRLWTEQLGEQCPTGVVVPFTDIGGTTHEANIECLFGLGITQGTSATTYGPGDPLTASQISRFLYRTYQTAGGDQCAGTDGSERDRAAECLVGLRVAPTTGEATSAAAVTRAQMGVYVIGLWHNLTGKGLPPVPPQLPSTATTTTTTTTTTQPPVDPDIDHDETSISQHEDARERELLPPVMMPKVTIKLTSSPNCSVYVHTMYWRNTLDYDATPDDNINNDYADPAPPMRLGIYIRDTNGDDLTEVTQIPLEGRAKQTLLLPSKHGTEFDGPIQTIYNDANDRNQRTIDTRHNYLFSLINADGDLWDDIENNNREFIF